MAALDKLTQQLNRIEALISRAFNENSMLGPEFAQKALSDSSEEERKQGDATLRGLSETGENLLLDMASFASERMMINHFLRITSLRRKFFDPSWFCDATWNMLLDLKRAEIHGETVAISSLCIASGIPETTALRYINLMAEDEWIVRKADPQDGRRVFVDLSDRSRRAFDLFFGELKARD